MADQRVVEFLDGQPQVRHFAAGRHIAVAEVLPGAKAAAFTGQQQYPHFGVLPHLFQGFLDLAVHLRVEAVELLGAVEAEQRNAGLNGKHNVFESHGLDARLRSRSSARFIRR